MHTTLPPNKETKKNPYLGVCLQRNLQHWLYLLLMFFNVFCKRKTGKYGINSLRFSLKNYRIFLSYLVSPAAVQQRATIWFHFNRSWVILGVRYQFALTFRRSAWTVAPQVFFGLHLCLFQPCGIHFMAAFAGPIWDGRRTWPVNWMHPFATMSLRFLDSGRLSTSPFFYTSRRFVIPVVTFYASHTYKAVKRTIDLYSRSLAFRLITLDPQTVWSRLKTEKAFTDLFLTSFLTSPTLT